MIKADYHVHSEFSMDSDEPMSESIAFAINNGFNEIMFTDHFEVFNKEDSLQDIIDYQEYEKQIDLLRLQYGNQIKIGFGAEINLELGMEEIYQKHLTRFPFDFIIGSVHNVNYQDVSHESYIKRLSVDDYHSKYFSAMLNSIESEFIYSVVGHLDLVTRYGNFEHNVVNITKQRQYLEPILKTIVHKGKGIEINTSAFRYGLGTVHPSKGILKLYKELGGEIITVGSDSHRAATIGMGFAYTRDLMLDLGFKYYTVFDKMQPKFIKL